MVKIKLTDFALRHFDPKFGGTKILDMSGEHFEKRIENLNINKYISKQLYYREYIDNTKHIIRKSLDGYAPFCKLLAIKNFTDAKVGSMPITLENYQYLRSGYSARREGELPVFSRWLELPLGKPKAEWLILVLYDKNQLDKEGRITEGEHGDVNKKYIPLNADWGIVAILGQNHSIEEPMKPETMLRNSGYNTEAFQKEVTEKLKKLVEDVKREEKIGDSVDNALYEILILQGQLNGGSGEPLNEKKYIESTKFWSENATVK